MNEEDLLKDWVNRNSVNLSDIENVIYKTTGEIIDNGQEVLCDFPLVSVIIPIYNRVSCVDRSIRCILEQSYPNIEIIIADDGSTDGLQDYIEKFNEDSIKYYKCEHNFIKTLNTAYKKANGKYIARLDSGDVMSKEKIYQQVLYLEKNPDVNGCLSMMSYNRKLHVVGVGEPILKEKHPGPFVPAASLMFCKDILNHFSDIIFFPEFATGGEDVALLNTIVHILNKKIVTLSCFNMNYYSLPTPNPSDWKWETDDKDIHLLEELYNKYR